MSTDDVQPDLIYSRGSDLGDSATIQTPHGDYKGEQDPVLGSRWAVGLFHTCGQKLSCESISYMMSDPSNDTTYHPIKCCTSEWYSECCYGSCRRYGQLAAAMDRQHLEAGKECCDEGQHCCCFAVLCTTGSYLFLRCLNPFTACLLCSYRNKMRADNKIPPNCLCLPWCECETCCCGSIGDYCTSCFCGVCTECQMTTEMYVRKKLPFEADTGLTDPLIQAGDAPDQLSAPGSQVAANAADQGQQPAAEQVSAYGTSNTTTGQPAAVAVKGTTNGHVAGDSLDLDAPADRGGGCCAPKKDKK